MPKKDSHISRRDFLTGSAATGLTIAGIQAGGCRNKSKSTGKANRSLRFAHLSDIHVQPKRGAPEGLTAALRHAQSLEDKPDMIITGGDNIMDCLGADDNWTRIQFQLLRDIFAKECKLPVKYCVGNHDNWGYDKKNSKTTGDEPLWGKKRPIHELGIPNTYYSFNVGKWQIIMLDSTQPDDTVYTARLDDEQLNWLKGQLQEHKNSYICIISHIPILSVSALLDGENERSGQWCMPDEWMHLDARKIKDLFYKHPNVRLCISGHMHLIDQAVYNDLTYVCDGAVCGAWWKGNHYECDEGYGVFDLYDDGSFEHQYISYGWVPVEEDSGKA